MRIVFLGILSVLIFASRLSHAAMTLVSISGASSQDLTTPTKPIVYAGFAGSCTGDGDTTCDSCTGSAISGSKLWPCNKKNSYPNLKLVIRLSTTTAGATATNSYIKISDEKYTPTNAQAMSDGVLTTTLLWSEICNHSKVGKGANCDGGSFTVDISIGFEVNNNGSTTSDSSSFKIAARVASTDGSDWFYTDCNSAAAVGNIGFCHFEVYPGDKKVYVDNLVVASGYPASPASTIEYSNVVYFFEKQLAGESDNDTIGKISNASESYLLGVQKSATPPIADNRIEDLENDSRYCFVMANQDITGVISYFTPILGVGGSPVTAAEICTSPSPVIGLLDDKSCFIATAAFGSDMAPQVQTFREFRNKFLLTSAGGREFVKFYYKYGPYYANWIKQSDTYRAIVRVFLWPLLIFVKMSLAVGVGLPLTIGLGFILLILMILKNWTSQAKNRSVV
jgi:hypothetical protein